MLAGSALRDAKGTPTKGRGHLLRRACLYSPHSSVHLRCCCFSRIKMGGSTCSTFPARMAISEGRPTHFCRRSWAAPGLLWVALGCSQAYAPQTIRSYPYRYVELGCLMTYNWPRIVHTLESGHATPVTSSMLSIGAESPHPRGTIIWKAS